MSKRNISNRRFPKVKSNATASALPLRLPDAVESGPRSHVSSCLAISPFYLHQLFLQFGPVDVISVELETGCWYHRKKNSIYWNIPVWKMDFGLAQYSPIKGFSMFKQTSLNKVSESLKGKSVYSCSKVPDNIFIIISSYLIPVSRAGGDTPVSHCLCFRRTHTFTLLCFLFWLLLLLIWRTLRGWGSEET